jgi:type I restriction enzyme, R subunit
MVSTGQVDHRHPAERLQLIPAGQEHILEQEDGKKRWVQVVTELSRAFALCAASDEATAIRDDVSPSSRPCKPR